MLREKRRLKLSQLAGGTRASVRRFVLMFFKFKIIIALLQISLQIQLPGKKEMAKGIHLVKVQINKGQCLQPMNISCKLSLINNN